MGSTDDASEAGGRLRGLLGGVRRTALCLRKEEAG